MNSIKLKIKFSGTHCVNCTHAIKKAISKMDGVQKVKLNFGKKNYIITINNNYDQKQLFKKIKNVAKKIEPEIVLKSKEKYYE